MGFFLPLNKQRTRLCAAGLFKLLTNFEITSSHTHTHTRRNSIDFLLSLLILSALNQIKEKRSRWPAYDSPYSETNISCFQCDPFFWLLPFFVQKTLMFLSSDFLLLSFCHWSFSLLSSAGSSSCCRLQEEKSHSILLTFHLTCTNP